MRIAQRAPHPGREDPPAQRAEKRFAVAQLEDLAGAELELLDQALVRLNLLIASEDDRVALRAVIDVLDRTLGRPGQQQASDRSLEWGPNMETALAEAREKLTLRLKRHAAPTVTSG